MDDRPTPTHCPYCSLQCGIALQVAPDRIHLTPQEDFPTNRGGLCSKGWTAAELLEHPERLTAPLGRDRRDAPLKPATWDDALNRVAQAISRSQQRHGRDSVGCFGGGGLTTEKAYQLGKFARVTLGTLRSSTTAGSACPRLPRRPPAHSASTGACHSRWSTSPRLTSSCWSARIRPTPCRRRCTGSMRVAAGAPHISPSTPGVPPPPVVPHFTCSQCPALIWHHRGEVYGLVAPLWEQAAVLADHITGADLGAAYHGSRLATKLKVAGVDVAAMGLKEPERPDDEDGAEHAGSRMALASLLKMMWTSSTSTSETPGSSTTGCTPISSGTTLSRWCHSSPVASPPRRSCGGLQTWLSGTRFQ